MTIDKLNSGSYRIRKQYKGKRYSITIDHKPTQKEAIELLAEILEDEPKDNNAFEAYCLKYINAKRNVLSPCTVKKYNSFSRNMSDALKNIPLHKITREIVQIEINNYSIGRAPKTVENYHGFISAVLKMYRPSLILNTTLPQKIKSEDYIPTNEEVKAILDYSKGKRVECALWLACYGLRRSETCALTVDDLSDDNVLTINKAMVDSPDGGYVIKPIPKTTESAREVPISDYVADLIRAQGYAYKGRVNNILEYLHRYQDRLGIPRFKLHTMRHYFASILSKNGIQEADIMKLGGWSTPHVMKAVYRHSLIDRDKEAKKNAIDGITKNISE